MRLEEYLQHKIKDLAAEIIVDAPLDACPCCHTCDGQLKFEDDTFIYECDICGQQWSTENLEIDLGGKISMLELAD